MQSVTSQLITMSMNADKLLNMSPQSHCKSIHVLKSPQSICKSPKSLKSTWSLSVSTDSLKSPQSLSTDDAQNLHYKYPLKSPQSNCKSIYVLKSTQSIWKYPNTLKSFWSPSKPIVNLRTPQSPTSDDAQNPLYMNPPIISSHHSLHISHHRPQDTTVSNL